MFVLRYNVTEKSVDEEIRDEIKSSMTQIGWFADNIHHVRSETMLEIISVDVSTKSRTVPTQVVGYVRILDNSSGTCADVFQREEHDEFGPDSIYSRELSLNDPTTAIHTIEDPIMSLELLNLDTCTVIAKGTQSLVKTTDDSSFERGEFESIKQLRFWGEGDGEFVDVRYISFTYGVSASIKVVLRSKRESHDEFDIYGDIIASYRTPDGTKIRIPLIKRTQHESELIQVDDPIELCRYKVVVPAYSSLNISVHLEDVRPTAPPLIDGFTEFVSDNFGTFWRKIQGNENNYAEVQVTWSEPHKLHKRFKETTTLPSFTTVPNTLPVLNARQVLEVFSVCVNCSQPDDAQSDLFGFVSTRDGIGRCRLFKRDMNHPYSFSGTSCLLPLVGPSHVVTPGDDFSIFVDLKDRQQRVNIKGVVHSSHEMNDRKKPWFDKLFCSVVKGDPQQNSFAAIYYTVFSYAVQGKVTVDITNESSSSDCVLLYGHVIASYDQFSYLTKYEKRHYRRVLFAKEKDSKRKRDSASETHDKLELLKTVIAVPTCGCLLLEVNLTFESSNGIQVVDQTVGFSVGDASRVISGDGFDVHIGIEWSSP